MKKKYQKYIISLCLIVFLESTNYAQNQIGFSYMPCTNCTANNAEGDPAIFQYGVLTNFRANHVASDFGPRDPNDYDWHNGVDFGTEPGDADLGDQLLAIEGGNVARILGGSGNDYVTIMIDGDNGHDFAFGHIFRDDPDDGDNLGNMVWIERGQPLGQAIIFVGDGRAIGESGGMVTYDGVTYNVQNHVDANDAIAPLGDSGSCIQDGSCPAHVHLYEIPASNPPNTGWGANSHAILLNALGSIAFPNPSHNPVLYHSANDPLTPGILLNYENTPTSIRIRDNYAGQNGALYVPDVNKIKFFIRTNDSPSSYEFIRGNSYISEINYGGILGGNKYPSYIVDNDTEGNATRTGVHPQYDPELPATRPFDDFFFSDFYIRIHRNDAWGGTPTLAFRNKDAKYTDGNYNIRVDVERLNGQLGNTVNQNINLDNFWPYIEGVNAYFNGNPVYSADYYSPTCQPARLDCDKVKFNEATYDFPSLPLSGSQFYGSVKLKVLASEALSGNISGQFWDASGTAHAIDGLQSLDGGKGLLWEITYDDILFVSGGEYKFEFYGEDMGGNDMLDFDMWGGFGNIETVPHRLSTTAWSPSNPQASAGKSRIFKFKFKGACPSKFSDDSPSNNFSPSNGPCDCEPVADFTYIPQSDGLTIDFDASTSSGTEPLTYAWSFGGDGEGTGIMPEHAFSEGGTHVITLTVTDECGNTSTAQQTVTVSEGESMEVGIQGPEQALPNQQVQFNAIVTGGVPPYKYTWSAINGDPAPMPGPSYKSDLHESEQIIVFHESTPIGTATVYVEVEDAAGHKMLVSHSIDISDNALTLDFNHFPTFPSGLSGGSPLIQDQYLYWVASVDPLLETPYPADYTWDFGDGTPSVTEPNGQIEHTFDSIGIYVVKLTMCDLFGSCITTIKTFTVGSSGGGPSGYVILPENTKPGVWTIDGPTYEVELANPGGSLCGDFEWTLNWLDCNYGALSQGSSTSSKINVNSVSFDDVSDPNGIRPWGCLSVFANDVGCGQAHHDCAVFIQPSALTVSNISILEESGCIYKLSAAVSGGGWKFENFTSDPNTPKMYKEYEWKAFDIDQPDHEIGILTGANTPTPIINTEHSYFKKFSAGNYPQFVVRLRVTDFANQIKEAGDVVSINAFRITAKDSYTRCPGTLSYFESTPLAQGGTRIFEFTWTTTSGNLDFESNDMDDPNPYFRAPANGIKTYNLLVKMLDGNGDEVCQLNKAIEVSTAPLTLSMPATAGACSTNGQATIGPSNLGVQGGSGNFGYEWTTADVSDLVYLSDVFAANPIVQGVPVGQTIVYTLRVGDLVTYCTATADVTVTGYENNISLTLPGALTVCYGEVATIRGNVNPFSQMNHEWTTNHPKSELLEFANSGPNKQLTFSEIMCSYPGTYNITLKATDIVSGCNSESATTLTVRNPWRYVGYVSKIKSAVKNSSQPLWEPGSANYFNSLPPNLNDIEVSWDPYPPANITYYGNTSLPSNGTFVPTREVPFLTMTVYDNATGCSKTLRTMRYIISEQEPELSLFAENTFSCIGGEVCFETIFDAQLANYSTSLLPSSITATVAINAPNMLQQPSFKFIPVQLLLQNASGLYKGSVCEADFFQIETGHGPHYTISLSMPSGIWNNVESPTIEVAINPTPTSLGHEIECVPLFNSVYQRGLSFRFGQQCDANKKHDFRSYTLARDYIELYPDMENDFEIEFIPSPIPGGNNRGAFFGINPCITQQMLEDAPVEDLTVISGEVRSLKVDTSAQSLLSMEVFPNPFGDEINVAFQIPTDCSGKTSITLFDITGKKIEVIHQQEHCVSGTYQLNYHAEQLTSGLYFCELRTCNNQRIIRKLVKISNH